MICNDPVHKCHAYHFILSISSFQVLACTPDAELFHFTIINCSSDTIETLLYFLLQFVQEQN